MMKKDRSRHEGIMSKFKGIFVKIIKNVDVRFDDYSILSMVRKVWFHCCIELDKTDFI